MQQTHDSPLQQGCLVPLVLLRKISIGPAAGADWGLKLEGEFDDYTSPIAGGPARDNKLVWCIGKGPHKLKFKPFKANKYPSYYKAFLNVEN